MSILTTPFLAAFPGATTSGADGILEVSPSQELTGLVDFRHLKTSFAAEDVVINLRNTCQAFATTVWTLGAVDTRSFGE